MIDQERPKKSFQIVRNMLKSCTLAACTSPNFFLSVKEEEKHCIWPSQCKYDSSDVYLRGSSAVSMFSNSKISEFGLKGEGTDFLQQFLELKNFRNSDFFNYSRVWLSQIGNFSHFWNIL